MEESEFTEEQIIYGLPRVEQEASVSSVLTGGSATAHENQTPQAHRGAVCQASGTRRAGPTLQWSNRRIAGASNSIRPCRASVHGVKRLLSCSCGSSSFWHRRKCDQQIHNYTGISKTR
jgi:hypothetical protein